MCKGFFIEGLFPQMMQEKYGEICDVLALALAWYMKIARFRFGLNTKFTSNTMKGQ